ncbi:MAG: hypothetical protein FWE37_03640 [Spirochaetaceae bacterium]|nr:hypothetical protein [Spirochaetaceae bacterium]
MLTPVVAFFYRVYGYVGQESLIKETSVKLDFTALHINNDEIIIFYSDINKLEFEYLNRNNRTFTPGCHLLRIRYKGKKTFSLVIYDNYSIYDAETYTGQFEEYAENLTRLRSLARTLKVIYNSKQRLYKLHQVKRELKAKN